MIKAQVPRMLCRVVDRAMQVFGAMGLSPDTPLTRTSTPRAARCASPMAPMKYTWPRLARWELEEARRPAGGQQAAYLTPPG